MVLALTLQVLLAWTRTWWSSFRKKRGKTILHLLRSLSTSMNSGFVTCSRFLAVLNIISSKMYAAKTVSSSFLSFDEYVRESSDQMFWIEVLNSCFAYLRDKLIIGGIVTFFTSVVSRITAREIKSVKSKLYQAKGLTLSGICSLY